MPRLDPDDLRAYAARDWNAIDAETRRRRARLPVAKKVELAVALYEAARATRPDGSDDDARREDLAAHLRVKTLLDRASHVGAG